MTYESARIQAVRRLSAGIQALSQLGASVDGDVGQPDPVKAVGHCLAAGPWRRSLDAPENRVPLAGRTFHIAPSAHRRPSLLAGNAWRQRRSAHEATGGGGIFHRQSERTLAAGDDHEAANTLHQLAALDHDRPKA